LERHETLWFSSTWVYLGFVKMNRKEVFFNPFVGEEKQPHLWMPGFSRPDFPDPIRFYPEYVFGNLHASVQNRIIGSWRISQLYFLKKMMHFLGEWIFRHYRDQTDQTESFGTGGWNQKKERRNVWERNRKKVLVLE